LIRYPPEGAIRPDTVSARIDQKAFILNDSSSFTRKQSACRGHSSFVIAHDKCFLSGWRDSDGFLYSQLCWSWRRGTGQAWEVRINTPRWSAVLHTYNRTETAGDDEESVNADDEESENADDEESVNADDEESVNADHSAADIVQGAYILLSVARGA